jgi:hypothetical protein
LEELPAEALLKLIESLDIITATCLCITNKTLYNVFKMRTDRFEPVSEDKKGKGKKSKKEKDEEKKNYIPVPLDLVIDQAPALPYRLNLRLQICGWVNERWPELVSYDPANGVHGMFVDRDTVVEKAERLKARRELLEERAAEKKKRRDEAKAETKEHLRVQAEKNGEEFDSDRSVSTVDGEESEGEESEGSVY